MQPDNTQEPIPNPSEIVAATPETRAAGAPLAMSGQGAVAENYVHSQLQKARKSLRLTQIFSILTVLGTLAYLGYITGTVRQSLQPAAAAEIADGLIAERVNEQAQTLAQQTREKVPGLIAGLPDYAIKELPGYRTSLESQIETDMRSHFASASKLMEGHVDEWVTANKTEIGSLLKTGQDPAALKQLGGALETEFFKFLKEVPLDKGGETGQQKLDQTLFSLAQVEKRIAHLAANKNLTPAEKKMRRAIAIMGGTIDRHIKYNGLTITKMPS